MLYLLSWKSWMGSRINPPQFKWKLLETWTATGPWGWMGSTQECWGSWWRWKPSHFPLSISIPGQPDRSQRAGGLPVWLLPTRRIVVRIQGTTSLSALVPRKVMEENILREITSTCKTTRESGLASMGSQKTGSASPTSSPSVVEWLSSGYP